MLEKLPQINKQYEPVVDGLRAIAVLAVLFFHFEPTGFSGGFIGVDIFFVISGYLITRNILSSISQGTFTFKDFYLRRVRRIFPAMFATMALVLILGVLIFFPAHLERLGESVRYAFLALSNVFFWKEAGYWDLSKDFKPLLHFWSLAVEEQFYLFWPALLYALVRLVKNKYALIVGIIGLSAISLAFAQYFLSKDTSLVFYQMPFRIFEFGLGAGLLWLEKYRRSNQAFAFLIALSGLLAIIFSVVQYSETTPFPGIYALLPCLGACGIIFARDTKAMVAMLGNKLMVGIGLISYSLYLVHWPIYVFYKYALGLDALSLLEIALLTSISMASAYMVYKFIEQPFRHSHKGILSNFSGRKIFAIVLGLFVILAIPAEYVRKKDGLVWEMRAREINFTKDEIEKMRANVHKIEHSRRDSGFFDKNPAKFIIIGDSYSRDIMNTLEYNSVKHPIQRFGILAGCLPLSGITPLGVHNKVKTKEDQRACEDTFNGILNSDAFKSAEVIILAAHWYEFGLSRIERTIKNIRQRTEAPIIFFGHRMMHKRDVPTVASQYGYKKGLDKYINSDMALEESVSLNNALKNKVEKTDAIYVDIIDILCPDFKCPILLDDGSISMIDDGHWSVGGAKLFGLRFKNSGHPAVKILLD